ncbi:hypothetical protein [Pseudoduganella sp.]|uniref:hypothetical protein n=1 Tax=Pseudoduganella sp. TaxID=1880898 RepID=UPI0035B0328A
MPSRLSRVTFAALAAAALAGCATLFDSTEQTVLVQTVLDHQQVSGIGCVLSNNKGRWFVTSPGRVTVHKSTEPLVVDCRREDVWAFDQIDARQNASRWGNIIFTLGAGQIVDKQTGAGFDLPSTLTVILQRGEGAAARGAPAQQPQPTTIY